MDCQFVFDFFSHRWYNIFNSDVLQLLFQQVTVASEKEHSVKKENLLLHSFCLKFASKILTLFFWEFLQGALLENLPFSIEDFWFTAVCLTALVQLWVWGKGAGRCTTSMTWWTCTEKTVLSGVQPRERGLGVCRFRARIVVKALYCPR